MTKQVSYKEEIVESMKWLAKQPDTVFTGYNICKAGRIYGTLNEVPLRKCNEMPVAENLIVGVAIGLALEGTFRPIIVFERMDFMANAVDAIINHLALLPYLSGGQFALPVIIRTIIGSNNKKWRLGPQHNKDLRYLFENSMLVMEFKGIESYKEAYRDRTRPIMVVEFKDCYELEMEKVKWKKEPTISQR